MLNKHQENSLINAENVLSGLLEQNYVGSRSKFLNFEDEAKGLPILIPADPTIFKFKDSDTFHIDDLELLDIYYGARDKTYTGFQHSFYTNDFLSKFEVLPKNASVYEDIRKANEESLRQIQELKSKYSLLAAFQTRNIPHFGHEAIIRTLLDHSDHVVVNPVIGPKKTGDLKLDGLEKVYNYIAQTKYNKNISFIPIRAMMFYAGPREAIHHAILRERLGFDLFTVGRDHAGADQFFNSAAAVKAIIKVQHKIQIGILSHYGAVFCPSCQDGVLIGKCCHDRDKMVDVSGSDFRQSIKNGNYYKFADYNMQLYLKNLTMDIFET
tara:strand:- start:3493 stop:4467 length:975 start_codon:yes stop_codon:yes gene_type:complete